MGIRKKLLIFICVVGVVTIMLVVFASEIFIRFNVSRIEDIQVQEALNQVESVLEDKIQRIDTFVLDYAGWDDTYTFIQDKNQYYIDTNIINETLLTTQLNFMLFYNKNGELVYSKAVDLNEGIGIFTPKALVEKIKQNPKILEHNNTNSVQKGYLILDDNTITIIAARPILTSQKTGPILGTVIFGEIIDSRAIKQLEQKIGKPLEIRAIDSAVSEIETTIRRPSVENINGTKTLFDLSKEKGIQINIDLQRDYLRESRTHLRYLIGIITLIGLLSYAAGALYVDKIMLNPLERIKKTLDKISTEKDLSSRIPHEGVIEILQLIEKINLMLDRISDYEVQLISLNEALKKENENIEQVVKQKISALKMEHANLMATLEAIPEGLVITDKNLKIIHNNNNIYEILGLENKKDKLSLAGMSELFKQDANLTLTCEDCLRYGQSINQEINVNDKFFDLNVRPIKDVDNITIVGLVIFIKDVTEEKIREKSQENLVNTLSHELRTPIAVINGNIGLIKTELKDTTEATNANYKHIYGIESASRKLLKLVNNFLTLYKAENNKLVFDPQIVNLKNLIQDILSLHKSEYEIKDLEIKLDVPETLEVYADEEKLKLVLENILMNSFKFTKEGSIVILSNLINSQHVEIKVIDTGSGIKEVYQQQLFKKFMGFDESEGKNSFTANKGIGLYISKLIIEKMGGSIYLESSSPEKGSIFVITLPLANS